MLNADIFVMGTPIWMGHPASPCHQAMERLDAMLAETDDGRPIAYGRVAIVAVVGNEDGAHNNVGASVFQGLNDIGFTIPAAGMSYWVGEVMGSVDYKDLDEGPDKTAQMTATAERNAAHLAWLLRGSPFPALLARRRGGCALVRERMNATEV